MLEGLDGIPWPTLRHAYGSAGDIPDRLRELASPESSVGEEALSALFGSIWHQGTVYEATAYAVPFLLELARAPEVHHRAGIVELLASIATGRSYLDVHQHLSLFDDRKASPTFSAELARELAWVSAAHGAAREGICTYVSLLEDPDADMRQAAAHALAAFPEQAKDIVPALLAAARGKQEIETGGILLLALGRVMNGKAEATTMVEELLRELTDPRQRLACAAALACIAQDRAPEEAVAILVDAFALPEPRPYSEVPYRPVKELAGLGRERGVPALCRALAITSDDDDAHRLAHALLTLAFGERHVQAEGTAWSRSREGQIKVEYWGQTGTVDPVRAQPLDMIQRAALRALVESDPIWRVQTNLFEIFGLPSERDGIAALIL